MKGLIPAFRDSLCDSTLMDSAIDIAEIGVDSILVHGILRDIPIVKTVIGIGEFCFKVRDLLFLKQTLRFFKHLHDGSITTEVFHKYKKELEENPKRAEQELSRVIILLDRTIDDEKTRILASFYRAYIKNTIAWVEFCELSESLDRLFVSDIYMLNKVAEPDSKMLYEEGGYIVDRLVSVGLICNPTSKLMIPTIGGAPPFGKIPLFLTELGKKFIQLNCNER